MTLIEILQQEIDSHQLPETINNEWATFLVNIKITPDFKVDEEEICSKFIGIMGQI